MKVVCLFEQSGTFKNAFKELGVDAFDYDIENNFNETDFQVDIFDLIKKDNLPLADLVICFFPCTYFCGMNHFFNSKKFSNKTRKERANERKKHYFLLNKLIDFYNNKKIPLIIENPFTASILFKKLKNERGIEPFFIDRDRTERGDIFKKPTMYYFFNVKLKEISFFAREIPQIKSKKIMTEHGFIRSTITKEYARNFIKEFIEL